jgi:hypothetical protein
MKLNPKIGETIESYGHPSNAVIEKCKNLGKELATIK